MKNKTTYSLLLIALIFNAILPAFLSFSSFAGSADIAALEKLYGKDGKVLICTSYGYKYVSIEDLKQDQKSPDGDKSHCPLCIISASNSQAITPELVSLDFEHYELSSYGFSFDEISHISEHNQSHNLSRAPPQIS